MRLLVWKEWRENRLLIVWAVALALVMMISAMTYAIATRTQQGRLNEGDLAGTFIVVVVASALLCGSSMISPEIGSGALQFLSVLPLTRRRIWWTKLAVELCLFVACVAAGWATTLVFCGLAVQCGLVDPSGFGIPAGECVQLAIGTLLLFAVGSIMSTLIDRMISTLMASLVVASGVGAVIGWSIYSVLSLSGVQPSDVMLLSISTLFIPVLFAMSYIVFTRGETLRTAKRFKVLAGFLLPPVTIIIGLAIAWLIVMF